MVALSDYDHLKDWHSADKALGDKESLKIGNNTELARLPNGDIVVTLHDNRIIRYKPSGVTRISDGGHQSNTTKDRLNRYTSSNVRIFQKDFVWYVKKNGKKQKFRDGMRV